MLEAQGAKPYTPTADDRLWLLRATAAEGQPVDTVPRVLVNLFMLQRAGGSAQSLATLVRAYAQPVNPRWYPNGDLFQKQYPKPTAAQLAQATARQNTLSARTSFTAPQTAAVDAAFSQGFASNATDYAAPTLKAKAGYTALTPPVTGVNRLWTRRASWAGYLADGNAGSAGNVALFAALAVGAWLVWKSA